MPKFYYLPNHVATKESALKHYETQLHIPMYKVEEHEEGFCLHAEGTDKQEYEWDQFDAAVARARELNTNIIKRQEGAVKFELPAALRSDRWAFKVDARSMPVSGKQKVLVTIIPRDIVPPTSQFVYAEVIDFTSGIACVEELNRVVTDAFNTMARNRSPMRIATTVLPGFGPVPPNAKRV